MVSMSVFVLVCVLCVVSAPYVSSVKSPALSKIRDSSLRSQNEVRYLPGYSNRLPSKHYSGYITVDKQHGKQLFYYLVLSEAAQQSDELIVWLTGGPGCSSLDAFTYEHGPFTYSFKPGSDSGRHNPSLSDIILEPNPFSWTKAACVLYIDSPVGTGFSYSRVKQDYHTDDHKTIDDLEVFVRQFFVQYPDLRRNRLYIAGESYGGVYVPLLTQRLLEHNTNQRLSQQAKQTSNATTAAAASSDQLYNLVGYIVGNAVTDDYYDTKGQVDFAYGMGLIDPATYEETQSTCKRRSWDITSGSPCDSALAHLESVMGPINRYDTLGACFFHDANRMASGQQANPERGRRSWPFAPAFPTDPATPITNMYAATKAAAAAAASHGFHTNSSSGTSSNHSGLLGHSVSCADRRHALVYFNSPVVRRAIHADSLEQAGRWEPCSDTLYYTRTAGSMIPVHKELLQAGLRGLVLSGDHDYVVPFTGSRAWVYSLGLKEAKPWHAWSMPNSKQVAGYAVQFESGLTFATVKGGGHMVPQTSPAEALALLQLWLEHKL